jgi:hypothetical protein
VTDAGSGTGLEAAREDAGRGDASTGGDVASAGPGTGAAVAPFAHASEAELARILDFYEVRWQYEPHVYPILWSLDGEVLESFAPDFYLPELDLYVELTTLRQRLVRKKNRKLRRLRELYPDIRIKLFYARDFRALMLKYGKLAIVDELSGSVGQVVPIRPDPPADHLASGAAVIGRDRSSDPGEPTAPGPTPGRPGRSPRSRRKREAATR